MAHIIVFPERKKPTLLQWLGLKHMPDQPPQRIYFANDKGLYVSDVEGNFEEVKLS